MTIEEIRKAKEELEKNIQYLIHAFEEETKIYVDDVNLDIFKSNMMESNKVLRETTVKLEVTL